MDEVHQFIRTAISDDVRRNSQPWLELDPNRDLTGIEPSEESQFESLADKQEYYRQPLYGKRFSTAIFLQPEIEFHEMTYMKARVPRGGRLLLLGEALEPTGLVKIAHQTLADGVEVVPHEMRPMIKARGGENRHWSLFRESSADYEDGRFDAVVASQMHHSDDYIPEFKALARIVKPGGKLVLVDYGPCPLTFELAKQDPLLNWLLRMFVTWAGTRRVPVERAYDYQKANWLSAPVDDIFAAARQVTKDTHLWEYKGMAIIDGVC
jgi:hypothetical protein